MALGWFDVNATGDGWWVKETQPKGWWSGLLLDQGGDVTVALTGKLITSAQGALTPVYVISLAGLAITTSAGSFAPSFALPLVGTLVPSASGTMLVISDSTVALAGLPVTSQAGSLTPFSTYPKPGIRHEMISPIKRPLEKTRATFDYTSILPAGEYFTTAVFHSSVYSGTDPNPLALVQEIPTVNKSSIELVIEGGLEGSIYAINCSATSQLGNEYQLGTYLVVTTAIN